MAVERTTLYFANLAKTVFPVLNFGDESKTPPLSEVTRITLSTPSPSGSDELERYLRNIFFYTAFILDSKTFNGIRGNHETALSKPNKGAIKGLVDPNLQAQMRHDRMKTSYDDLFEIMPRHSGSQGRNILILGLCGIAGSSRNQDRLLASEELHTVAKFMEEVTKQDWYKMDNCPKLNWNKVAKNALTVIYAFEKNHHVCEKDRYYLTHPEHFEQALKMFHEEMKNNQGWEGHANKEPLYSDEEKFKSACKDEKAILLITALAVHGLFREDNEIGNAELGYEGPIDANVVADGPIDREFLKQLSEVNAAS